VTEITNVNEHFGSLPLWCNNTA